MKKTLQTGLLLLGILPLSLRGAENILDRYIQTGLRNNLALQQQEFSLRKSLEALKEARGLFFPNVTLMARYTRAGGGRIIEFPVGDIVNPLYLSLNNLFQIHGITTQFPTDIPNERFNFFRKEEQETKIRIVQPLFRPDILFNYKIKSHLNRASKARVAVFKRQLIAEIKTAYFNYLKTLNVEEVLQKTKILLEENLRVSRILYEAGKATEDILFRARAEISGIEQKLSEAQKARLLAASYFNFLLNRDLKETIQKMDGKPEFRSDLLDLDKAIASALAHREEFEMISQSVTAASNQVSLTTGRYLPTVSAVVDLGIQGENYIIHKDSDFWMASVVFEWTIFNGSQTKAQKAQAVLEKQKLEAQKGELIQQIRLQVADQFNAQAAAGKAVQAAREKEKSAEQAFHIVAKKFENGMAPQIEYLDARTTYTNAALNTILNLYDYYIQRALLEKETGVLNLALYEEPIQE